MRKQPKTDMPISVVTEVEVDHYRIKNWIATEWSPIIGPHAVMLYNIYSAAANKERGNSWFFSLRTLKEFTYFGSSTINMNNWLLEACGLILIKSGNKFYANEYMILNPPHCTPELLKHIVTTLQAPTIDVGQNWQNFKQNAVNRINRWKILHECGKISQYCRDTLQAQEAAGEQDMFADNGSESEPTTAEPLEARLVTRFADNKPKLTEKGAVKMIKQYGSEAVEQQLEWLHLRDSAENPLRTFRASLKHDWAVPESAPEPETWHGGELDPVTSTNNGNQPPETEPATEPVAEPETELQKQWAKVLERVQESMTQTTYDGWLRNTTLERIEGNVWVVGCETSFVKDWLENRLIEVIRRTVQSVSGSEVELKFVVKEAI